MEFDNSLSVLHEQIAAVCPIDGVSIWRWDNRDSWRIDFKEAATDAEKAAARAVVAGFDRAAVQATQRAKREREALVQSKLRELAERLVDDPAFAARLGR